MRHYLLLNMSDDCLGDTPLSPLFHFLYSNVLVAYYLSLTNIGGDAMKNDSW